MKKLSSEILVGIALFVASLFLLAISHERVLNAFCDSWYLALKTIFLTILAVGISVVIHFLVPDDFAERYLSGSRLHHWLGYLLYATVLGILTPGPVYAIYPIVMVLKRKGVKNSILVSYITGQTIIGPARIPFEVGLFGLNFFLYRLMLAIPMGVLAGFLYMRLSRYWPDQKGPMIPKTDISARAAESTDL